MAEIPIQSKLEPVIWLGRVFCPKCHRRRLSYKVLGIHVVRCSGCGNILDILDTVIEANDEGTTRYSLKFYHENKEKLGKLLIVQGNNGVAPDFYLKFEEGTVHFTGLNCGYWGEGPKGLATILYEEGFFKSLEEAREYVASNSIIDLRRGMRPEESLVCNKGGEL